MATFKRERVENALNQLLERIVPEFAEDDEDIAEQRLQDAKDFALAELTSAGEPSMVPDIEHLGSLIEQRLTSSNDPQRSARFRNLLSRLVSQPVLDQKWRMLYFLNEVADISNSMPLDGSRGSRQPSIPLNVTSPQVQALNNPAFRDAFARPGLSQLPANAGSPKAAPRPVPVAERTEKKKERRVQETKEPQTNGQPKSTSTAPSEPALLRDLPFTLQGLSSTNLTFPSPTALRLPANLPVPIISLLHTLAEPAILYRGLADFVESNDGGLIGQSFRSALATELRAYLGLVATLEGQIRRALTQLNEGPAHSSVSKAGVTLKRCVIWIREPTMGLRLMSLMVEESKSRKGGELISLIHSFSLNHGDPYVMSFAERLLSSVTRPFYDMLRQWVYDGELADPYGEFFVSEQSESEINEANGTEGKGGATSVWEDKYKLSTPMIPSIITPDFAQKVFLIGKTLNFIRYGCGDAAWVDSYAKRAPLDLAYGDTATLERSIDEAYKTTMARLTDLMANRFRLFDHLAALKSYMLLGAGDFVALLMESLATNLDRPANTQYRHTLTAQLEHAVRNSNAQFDPPDVLRRLDARMLELSHGEIGWDVFTLEYKIDAPVDVIVTPFASKQYLKIFNLLWRVKRVEFALGLTWRRSTTGARGILASVGKELGGDWKSARAGLAEMVHAVAQLQHYILFEVIERSWAELQTTLARPDSTLDDLIGAHATYLRNITRKGLLGGGSSNTPPNPSNTQSSTIPTEKERPQPSTTDYAPLLHALLKSMLAFRDAVEALWSLSVAVFSADLERAARVELRTAAGRWGVSEADASPVPTGTNTLIPPFAGTAAGAGDDASTLPILRTRLSTLVTTFRAQMAHLLGELQHSPDGELKMLAVNLNFNDVYRPERRRKRGGRKEVGGKDGRETGRETPAPGIVRPDGDRGGATSGTEGTVNGKEREKGKGKSGA